MAARRVKANGRLWLTALLVAFLAISATVIVRRSIGTRGAREIVRLEAERAALTDERLRLEAAIRLASSRMRLQPIAEQRLGMHVPPDSLVMHVVQGRMHETP